MQFKNPQPYNQNLLPEKPYSDADIKQKYGDIATRQRYANADTLAETPALSSPAYYVPSSYPGWYPSQPVSPEQRYNAWVIKILKIAVVSYALVITSVFLALVITIFLWKLFVMVLIMK